MGAFRDHVELRYPAIAERAFVVRDWSDTDMEDNPKRDKNYHPFTYTFNSYGFRCDEFNEPSELPVVFLGCSITEGVGIRAESRWSRQLLSKIEITTGKKIPYWNLSLGGRGLLSQLDLLHAFTLEFGQPAHVFAYVPPFSRLEYAFETDAMRTWTVHSTPDDSDLLADSNYRLLQYERALNYADTYAKNCNFTLVMWGEADDEKRALARCQALNNFSITPGWHDEKARDGIHPGDIYHFYLYRYFWDNCQGRF